MLSSKGAQPWRALGLAGAAERLHAAQRRAWRESPRAGGDAGGLSLDFARPGFRAARGRSKSHNAQRVTFTLLMWTGVIGLSFASVGTAVIAFTTLTGSHSPKIVYPASSPGCGVSQM